jgi:tetratricopeptide (TPR) repeat protein
VRDFSTREVAEIARLPETQVRRWARAGLIRPRKDARGHWRYGFQDLALLRTARKLLDADVSPKRVARTLHQLREQLPHGRPLSAVRILVTGGRVVVRDRLSAWEPESRQGALELDPASLSQEPVLLSRDTGRAVSASESVAGHYAAALDLELAGQIDAAECAYESVLELDPEHVAARINLGRLLHQQGRLAQAEACYRQVLSIEPDNAIAAFNLGVVLEDRDETDAALAAYRRTLTIDDSDADAHFNLARLLEARGDQRGALRHLSRFRRLTKAD